MKKIKREKDGNVANIFLRDYSQIYTSSAWLSYTRNDGMIKNRKGILNWNPELFIIQGLHAVILDILKLVYTCIMADRERVWYQGWHVACPVMDAMSERSSKFLHRFWLRVIEMQSSKAICGFAGVDEKPIDLTMFSCFHNQSFSFVIWKNSMWKPKIQLCFLPSTLHVCLIQNKTCFQKR